jgi:hypothetical protein
MALLPELFPYAITLVRRKQQSFIHPDLVPSHFVSFVLLPAVLGIILRLGTGGLPS